MNKTYSYDEVCAASLDYFQGDQLAAEVFSSKYALQDGDGGLGELTPDDMHRRLAREFARIEAKYPSPMTEELIYELLSDWSVVAQGSPMSGVGNPYQTQSLSNCFVVESPHDSYGGILKVDQEQAQIMKRRGGVGFDISTIRPKGLSTSNAARTTDGIGIFMERFSNTCREVAQNGRRGALMLTLSVHHPEVRTFINIKRDLKQVTGANISLRLSDEFMQAVKVGDKVQLRFPVDKSQPADVEDWVDARTLWHELVDAAWTSAEPGLLFWDTVLRRGPADAYTKYGYGSTSTNPCITGETLIAVADGRNAVSISQLAQEGSDVAVYSTNPKTGQIEIKMARNPRLTKRSTEIWKIKFDDGSELKATPDHKILTRDLRYVKLKDLQSGDSIFPFNTHNNNGYRQVSSTGALMKGGARRNRRQYRLIYDFFFGGVDPKKYAIHHVDYDSLNDSSTNLVKMLHEDHRRLHADNMMGEKNPYHQMSAEWKHQFACHPGESNGRYSGHTNKQLIEYGRKLFRLNGKITNRMWVNFAKKKGLPQFLGNDFRFGSWQNFANQVVDNHKVVSVEPCGISDVYNITVDDNHNYHIITSSEDEKFVVSSGICVKNCGEITLSPYDSCRLLLNNLYRFVIEPFTPAARFDFERYDRVAQCAQRLMDDLVDLELESVEKIITKIKSDPEPDDVKRPELDLWKKIRSAAINGRRTGLGITALGDALAALGIKYGSDEAVEMTEKIYRAHALASYKSSVQMAKERGTFPAYDYTVEQNHEFIRQIMDQDAQLDADYKQYGRRNIANTTTAPAGSVSILAQTTSGCEPAFLLMYDRWKKMTDADDGEPDRIDDAGDKWKKYRVYHHGFKAWMKITGMSEDDVEKSPYWGATSNDIDWVKKIDMQAAAQKWICHSISNTTNIPKDTPLEIAKKIYMRGWETGCKGVTIYREGSRDGVLTAVSTTKKEGDSGISENHAPKRPKKLHCDIHRASVKGEKYVVLVGKLLDRPYEIFCGLSEHIEIPRKSNKGILLKNGKVNGVATYNLSIPIGDDDELLLKNVVEIFDNPVYGTFTRALSLALRHGVPVQYIVEQLRKDKSSDMTSFNRVVARILSKAYIVDGTPAVSFEKMCVGERADGTTCGSTNLAYQGGCVTCMDCGNSKCS